MLERLERDARPSCVSHTACVSHGCVRSVCPPPPLLPCAFATLSFKTGRMMARGACSMAANLVRLKGAFQGYLTVTGAPMFDAIMHRLATSSSPTTASSDSMIPGAEVHISEYSRHPRKVFHPEEKRVCTYSHMRAQGAAVYRTRSYLSSHILQCAHHGPSMLMNGGRYCFCAALSSSAMRLILDIKCAIR